MEFYEGLFSESPYVDDEHANNPARCREIPRHQLREREAAKKETFRNTWTYYKKLQELAYFSKCQMSECTCMGWKISVYAPDLPNMKEPVLPLFTDRCARCYHELDCHLAHLRTLPMIKIDRLINMLVDYRFLMKLYNHLKDSCDENMRHTKYACKMIQKAINTWTTPRMGYLGTPPFETPSIWQAITNFIEFWYSEAPPAFQTTMNDFGNIFITCFNRRKFGKPIDVNPQMTKLDDIYEYEANYKRWFLCCQIPVYCASLPLYEPSRMFGRNMLRVVFCAVRAEIVRKIQAQWSFLMERTKREYTVYFPRFMRLLEHEIYSPNSPIFDPEYKAIPLLVIYSMPSDPKNNNHTEGVKRASDSPGMGNAAKRQQTGDDDEPHDDEAQPDEIPAVDGAQSAEQPEYYVIPQADIPAKIIGQLAERSVYYVPEPVIQAGNDAQLDDELVDFVNQRDEAPADEYAHSDEEPLDYVIPRAGTPTGDNAQLEQELVDFVIQLSKTPADNDAELDEELLDFVIERSRTPADNDAELDEELLDFVIQRSRTPADECAILDEEPVDYVIPRAETPVDYVIPRAETPVDEYTQSDEEPVHNVIPRAETPVDEYTQSDEEPVDYVIPRAETPVDYVIPRAETPVDYVIPRAETPVDEYTQSDEEPVHNVIQRAETPVDEYTQSDEEPVDYVIPRAETPVDYVIPRAETPVDEYTQSDEEPIHNVIPRAETPVDEYTQSDEEPVDYVIPRAETPVDYVIPRAETPVDYVIPRAETPVDEYTQSDEEPVHYVIQRAETPADEIAQPDEKPADDSAHPDKKPAEVIAELAEKPADHIAELAEKPADELAELAEKLADDVAQEDDKPADGVAELAEKPADDVTQLDEKPAVDDSGSNNDSDSTDESEEESIEFHMVGASTTAPIIKSGALFIEEINNVFAEAINFWRKQDITNRVYDHNNRTLIIVNEKGVAGGICFRKFFLEGFTEIIICAVKPSEQGKGYGRKLMDALKNYQIWNEIEHLLATVSDEAIGFFEKLGFSTKIGIRRNRYEAYIDDDYEDATLMYCRLEQRFLDP